MIAAAVVLFLVPAVTSLFFLVFVFVYARGTSLDEHSWPPKWTPQLAGPRYRRRHGALTPLANVLNHRLVLPEAWAG